MVNRMKRHIHYLEYLYCHLLVIFLLGRVGFILNNRVVEHLSLVDAAGALWRGFVGHDLMVAAFLLAVPWLVGLMAVRGWVKRLRAWLAPYYVLMGCTVATIIVADAVMYEYWQFKLGSVVLTYAASPEGATNSVSFSYIFVRAVLLLVLALWTVVPCILLTPKSLPRGFGERLWMRNISIIWSFLLVSGVCFMQQGDVYTTKQHPTQLADHAAVNPVYAFAKSIRLTRNYAARYDCLSDGERKSLMQGLFPEPSDDIRDTLLNCQRPDILVVFLESFGGRFVEELGGLPGVAPGWSRLIPEGVFWQNFYSNSFRTDRGTVSTFCGWPSPTDMSLMKRSDLHAGLPSLARSLAKEGYETGFLYGGAMTNMGKGKFLRNMDFANIYDDTAFGSEQKEGSWGVHDSIVMQRAVEIVKGWKDGHHFLVTQTLSSHEPWDVPYHRLEDRILNAFAYTDYSLACMMDSLRRLPQWQNLLVVVLPDHGFLYEQSYKDPIFFRAPMLWSGGAVRQPRRMDVLMNQSDLAATLLSQLDIRHADFPWSRNVLSKSYTYPFVCCNWPAGLLFADSTGLSIFDIEGNTILREEPDDGGLRTMRAKAILQTTYDGLAGLRESPPQ